DPASTGISIASGHLAVHEERHDRVGDGAVILWIDEHARGAVDDRIEKTARTTGHDGLAAGRGLEAHDAESFGAAARSRLATDLRHDIGATIHVGKLLVAHPAEEHDVAGHPDAFGE